MSLPSNVEAALDRLPRYNYNSGTNPTYNFGGDNGYGYVTLLPMSLSDLAIVAAWLADVLDTASAADYRAGTAGKILLADTAWLAGEPVDAGNVTGTIALDLSTFINRKSVMTGNVTLGAVSNAKPGQTGVLEFVQDATGGRTLGVNPTYWQLAGGEMPLISADPNSRNVLAYFVQGNGKLLLSLIGADVK